MTWIPRQSSDILAKPRQLREARSQLTLRNDFVLQGSLLCTAEDHAPITVQATTGQEPSKDPPPLQHIFEIRPQIAQRLDLLLRLALRPVIPAAGPPLPILPLQQRILQHAAPEQEDCQVAQYDAVALSVQWGVFGLVDVGGDDAVEVAPADDEAQGYAALVDAFRVVGGPDDGVGDARVDAHCAEEGAGVADSGRCAGGSVVSSEILIWW